ncbi:MAG: Maf family protein [Pseudomonadota bacterium]
MNFRTIGNDYPLILASASPRRKRLLQQIGLPYLPLKSHVEENQMPDVLALQSPSPEIKPGEQACFLAEKKARAVLPRSGNRWVLGADTIVVLGEKILGKPADRLEAQYMLLLLGGKEHRVITGFCLIDPSGKSAHVEGVTTSVRVKRLTREEIEAYIATGEPFGKAGSYAIQGIGAFLIESISGSYTNVVGLPLCALVKALIKAGAVNNFPLFQ